MSPLARKGTIFGGLCAVVAFLVTANIVSSVNEREVRLQEQVVIYGCGYVKGVELARAPTLGGDVQELSAYTRYRENAINAGLTIH